MRAGELCGMAHLPGVAGATWHGGSHDAAGTMQFVLGVLWSPATEVGQLCFRPIIQTSAF